MNDQKELCLNALTTLESVLERALRSILNYNVRYYESFFKFYYRNAPFAYQNHIALKSTTGTKLVNDNCPIFFIEVL